MAQEEAADIAWQAKQEVCAGLSVPRCYSWGGDTCSVHMKQLVYCTLSKAKLMFQILPSECHFISLPGQLCSGDIYLVV